MGGRRWSGIAAVLTASALLWAAPASAYVEVLPTSYGAFFLHGTHGYSILVRSYPGEGSRDEEVNLTVFREGAVAFYEVPAKVTATKIKANLGDVGRISVSFHPRGKPRIAHAKCDRRAELEYQPGVWAGKIEFRGEEGFTQAQARSAKQITWPLFLIACPFVSEPEEIGPEFPGARVAALWRSKSYSVGLLAITNRAGDRLKLSARTEQQKGQVHIARLVEGFYPGTGFEFDSALSTATLRPSGSFFSGTATFSRSAEPQNRWSGDLSVDFPGRSNVSLAGPRFRASLDHARYTRELRYDERLAKERKAAE
jgi:hypothetical protein